VVSPPAAPVPAPRHHGAMLCHAMSEGDLAPQLLASPVAREKKGTTRGAAQDAVLVLVERQCAGVGGSGRGNACCGGHDGDAGSGGAQDTVAHLNQTPVPPHLPSAEQAQPVHLHHQSVRASLVWFLYFLAPLLCSAASIAHSLGLGGLGRRCGRRGVRWIGVPSPCPGAAKMEDVGESRNR
jgi:hypothetical protein